MVQTVYTVIRRSLFGVWLITMFRLATRQHSPLRIPYDDFVVKEDSRNGGYAITEIVTLNNQMSLLDYGTVRTQSNSVWEKIGGIAHFVGEEGEE